MRVDTTVGRQTCFSPLQTKETFLIDLLLSNLADLLPFLLASFSYCIFAFLASYLLALYCCSAPSSQGCFLTNMISAIISACSGRTLRSGQSGFLGGGAAFFFCCYLCSYFLFLISGTQESKQSIVSMPFSGSGLNSSSSSLQQSLLRRQVSLKVSFYSAIAMLVQMIFYQVQKPYFYKQADYFAANINHFILPDGELLTIRKQQCGLIHIHKSPSSYIFKSPESSATAMMCMMGARNTRGFSQAVQYGNLPDVNHLTYEGVFNEIKFGIGPKTDKIVDLHFGYARHQFAKSRADPTINDYLAMFVKSSKDGADRDATPINALLCLDISGSMSSGLSGSAKESRLSLSIEAIKMFIGKLRPDDSVGLVMFDNKADVVFPPTLKSQIGEKVYQQLDAINTRGGTTIHAGFKLSKELLMGYVKKNNLHHHENRIIMLTDVCDNSLSGQKNFLEKASQEDGINLTIIGISEDFRSHVCEELKNIKGFNYFCAVTQEDLKKYVYETFDFGFFPAASDINVSLSCDNLANFDVYGSPDSDLVRDYNDFYHGNQTSFTVTKMKSAFPSELEIHQDTVYTIGGLILLKLKRKNQSSSFKGRVNLTYKTPTGQQKEQSYDLSYEFHPQEQFYSADSLKDAIEGFAFTSELRTLITSAKEMKREQIYQEYMPLLQELQSIVPKCKQEDLKKIKDIVEGYKPKQQLKKEKQEEEQEGGRQYIPL